MRNLVISHSLTVFLMARLSLELRAYSHLGRRIRQKTSAQQHFILIGQDIDQQANIL